MSTDPQDIGALAEAVASGATVDWDSAERLSNSAEVRRVVQELKFVEAIGKVHAGAGTTDAAVTSWGRFEGLTPVGAGSFGTVYRCWDPLLERAVALKLLKPGSSRDGALVEARMLAKVQHPNVVTIYGADVVDGRGGFWMELLTGRSLKEEVAVRGPLPLREVALIGTELCRGLAAVHAAGLVHGDVKVQNVMREPDGRIILMDFGAGVNHDADATRGLPASAGTPHYMAPEVFDGGPCSVRSDIYSVGTLLFYLATGEFPIVAHSIEQLVEGRRVARRRTMTRLRPDAPPWLAAVIERALAAEPDDRFGSALELCAALEATLADLREQEKERRRRWWPWVASAAVVALLAAAGIWSRGGSAPPAVRSIAVLPFANLSGNGDEEYLADGLTDMLTSDLAQFSALRVTSRTSSMRYKQSRDPLPSIAQALHADALVEGSLMHAGGRLRVTAQVIRSSTDQSVWSQTFERRDDDVFALQAQISSAIAEAIKLVVTPGERQRVESVRTVKPEAQDAYLRGRYLMSQATAESQRAAMVLLKRAIELDPSYARAYSALGHCYSLLLFFAGMPAAEAYPAAYEAATRAVALDDSLADAHAELADILLYYKWDWSSAGREYRRSIELDRSNTIARSHYSRYLSALGRHADALEQARLTVDGDPFSGEALNTQPLAHYYAGRWAESVKGFEATIRVLPNSAVSHFGLGRALAEAGDFTAAESEIRVAARLSKEPTPYNLELARTMIAAGRQKEGLEVLAAVGRAPDAVAPYLAYIHAALGDRDKAFQYLTQAVRDRNPSILWAKVDPRLAPLRSDGRFAAFLQSLGLPE